MKGQARALSVKLSLNNLLGHKIYRFKPMCIFSWYFFFFFFFFDCMSHGLSPTGETFICHEPTSFKFLQ